MNKNIKTDECCPPFDSNAWDNKIVQWTNKTFIKQTVCTFMYIPIGFGRVMRKFDKLTTASGAKNIEYMCLSDHPSPWKMNVYYAVDKEVPNAENIKLNGSFLSRVYEGNFNETGNRCREFETEAKQRGLKINKMYMWYTTCPKCAKKYGKNYVVIIGEIIAQ